MNINQVYERMGLKRPTIISGLSHIVGIFEPIRFNSKIQVPYTDLDALQHDWEVVCRDMEKAVRTFESVLQN